MPADSFEQASSAPLRRRWIFPHRGFSRYLDAHDHCNDVIHGRHHDREFPVKHDLSLPSL
jgi:hypothetical protein